VIIAIGLGFFAANLGWAQGEDGTFRVRKAHHVAATGTNVNPIGPNDQDEPLANSGAGLQRDIESESRSTFPYETPEGKLSGLYQLNRGSNAPSSSADTVYHDSVEYLRFYPDGKVYYIKSMRTPKRVEDLLNRRPHKLNRQRGSYAAVGGAVQLQFDHYMRQENYQLEFAGGQPAFGRIQLTRIIRKEGQEFRKAQTYQLCRHTEEDFEAE